MNLLNNMILGFGLDGVYDWVKTQGKYALGIIIIGLVIFCIAKRAWGFLVTIVIAGGLGFFLVAAPETLEKVGSFLGGMLGM